MAVKKYIPIHIAPDGSDYAALIQLQRDIDKAFRAMGLSAGEQPESGHSLMRSRVGIVKSDRCYILTIDVAGLAEDRVKLALANRMLILKGEKEQDTAYTDQEFRLTEHSYSSFERRLSLPEDIDEEHIEAHFENGMLVVNLARAVPENQSKRIGIRAHE